MKRRVLMVVMLCIAALLTLGTGVASARNGADSGGSGGTATGGGGGGGTTVGESADIQISGSASTGSPDPGSAYTYTYTVKNSGPANTTVAFSDLLPTNVTPNFAVAAGSTTNCVLVGDLAGGTTVQCNLGLIIKGGQAQVQVNVTAPQVAQAVTNTVSVTGAVADPKVDNNTNTINVAVKAPTGGVCKGGVCDTVPDAQAPACATLTSVTAPVGYYSTWAAVWNDFTIQSCSTGTDTVTVQVTETNVSTGSVDYDVIFPIVLGGGQNASYVLDNDFAPFNTTYRIDYTVRDSATGAVLSTASTTATTPAPR